MFSGRLCLLQLIVLKLAFCEWVEITQSARKSYLVTPYTPYVYTPSLFFTSTTTEQYPRLRPLSKPKFVKPELKKSTPRMPDFAFGKTTTAIPFRDRPTLKPVITYSHVSKLNVSLPDNFPKRSHLYQVHNKQTFETTTPPPVFIDAPEAANKNFQATGDEDEFEERDEYELVYDDDEDNYRDGPNDPNDEEDDDEDADDGDDDNSDDPFEDSDDEYTDEYDDDNEKDDEPPPVSEFKANAGDQATENANSNGFSYANFLPYLRNIQSTLIRTSHTDTVKSKVSFLSDIKNRLLYAIQSRINSIWEPKRKRKARSVRGDMWDSWGKVERGMEFPSNEGALLTLGFLTFAVFLIKCILKLIYAIKGKHHTKGVTQIIIQNGTAISALNGLINGGRTFQPKADMDNLEVAKFMANLDGYTPPP